MNDTYQVILITAVVLLVLQFLFMRYYVSNVVDQVVESVIDDKIKRGNRKVMKSVKSSFEKYMGPDPRTVPKTDLRMIDPRMDYRTMEEPEKDNIHRSRYNEDEDSIDDPVDDDRDNDDDDSLD